MNVEDRLAALEKQLRRTRLLLLGLFVCLLLVGTVAAEGPFVDLVSRSLSVKDPKGNTVIELKDSGDIKARKASIDGLDVGQLVSGDIKVRKASIDELQVGRLDLMQPNKGAILATLRIENNGKPRLIIYDGNIDIHGGGHIIFQPTNPLSVGERLELGLGFGNLQMPGIDFVWRNGRKLSVGGGVNEFPGITLYNGDNKVWEQGGK